MCLCYPVVEQVVQCAHGNTLKHQTGPVEVIRQTHCHQLQQLWVEQLTIYSTHTNKAKYSLTRLLYLFLYYHLCLTATKSAFTSTHKKLHVTCSSLVRWGAGPDGLCRSSPSSSLSPWSLSSCNWDAQYFIKEHVCTFIHLFSISGHIIIYLIPLGSCSFDSVCR